VAQDLAQRLVYHFTHVDNLPGILEVGGLLADSAAAGSSLAVDVGDRDIKDARRRRVVPIPPGGPIADYVPFYFAPRSPMMYRIACDCRDGIPGRYADGDDPLVYLVSSMDRIVAAGLRWVGTDGNAAAAVSRFAAATAELEEMVDWPLMSERIWKDVPDDLDRRRRRMAELLVHRRVPLDSILGFAVRTAERQRAVRTVLSAYGLAGRYLAVRPAWYYSADEKGVAW
jgi:hypothetical protein